MEAYSTLNIPFTGIQPELQWISELNEKQQYMRKIPTIDMQLLHALKQQPGFLGEQHFPQLYTEC